MTELLPCPFCGQTAGVVEDRGNGEKYIGPHFIVRCPPIVGDFITGCLGNFTNLWDITPEDAAKRWNTRPPQQPAKDEAVGDELEALERNLVDAMNTIHRLDQSRARWADRAIRMRRTLRRLSVHAQAGPVKSGWEAVVIYPPLAGVPFKGVGFNIRPEAPTGQPARAWTEQEKRDVRAAMQRIVDREEVAMCEALREVREHMAAHPETFSNDEIAAMNCAIRRLSAKPEQGVAIDSSEIYSKPIDGKPEQG